MSVLALAAVAALPVTAAGQSAGTAAEGAFVPVAIWELQREGFPAVRHAWVAGSDRMMRISWDDGATWFAFKPVYADAGRGMLALSVQSREEAGRGEVAWREKAVLTVVSDRPARVVLPASASSPALDVTLALLEVKEVPPSELKPEGDATSFSGEPNPAPMAGGGGTRSCCVSCQGVLVCDCAICIPACHAWCCAGGCFCPPC